MKTTRDEIYECDEKTVQIPMELFRSLYCRHCLGMWDDDEYIKRALQVKSDSIILRRRYQVMISAETEEERQEAEIAYKAQKDKCARNKALLQNYSAI